MHASYRRVAVASVATAGILLTAASAARGQAFANLKNSLVNYSVADAEPKTTCDALATSFKDKDVVSLKTRTVPAAENAPAHCRVSGVLSPEIGFEVNLPAQMEQPVLHDRQRRPRRRAAGRSRSRVAATRRRWRTRFVMVEHRTLDTTRRKEPAGAFVLRNPPDGDRLRLSRRAPDRHDGQGDHERVLRQAGVARLLELVFQRRPPGPDRGAALSRRFRRHRRQRAVGRSDRLHDRRDVESAGADGRAVSVGQAEARRRARDGQVRRDRRPQRRPDRRSAQVRFRPGARRARA